MLTRKTKNKQRKRSTPGETRLPATAVPSFALHKTVGSGFAPWTRRTLYYAEALTLTTTAGTPSRYVYRANSMFDPNFTGTGHQPRGFDQMTAIYTSGYVIGSRIIVKGIANQQLQLVLLSSTSNGTPPGTSDALELGRSDGIVSIVGLPMFTLTATFNVHRDLHKIDPSDDDTLFFTAGADALNLWYYQIVVDDVSLNTATATLQVLIEYDAVFVDPILLPAS